MLTSRDTLSDLMNRQRGLHSRAEKGKLPWDLCFPEGLFFLCFSGFISLCSTSKASR